VLVPIARRSTHDDTRLFASVVAQALARTHPDLVTTERARARRRGVLVDAQMNGEGMQFVSVYSVRPRPRAPVATPLAWEELEAPLDPAAFTMDVVRERVARLGDLHAPLLDGRQRLDRALSRLGA
jgi:bifunctional non-homologous end joining protein LigD